jgi:LmbE family N-acetylglucosaminyl deacetylase
MILADPNELFQNGVVLVLAPHMDDEILACGGTIALLDHKDRIHVSYATDGARSPVPALPWLAPASPDLASIRFEEAKQALSVLGVPERNLHFFGFPDGKLKEHRDELRRTIIKLISDCNPRYLFVPFRYDRHPDHLTLNSAIFDAIRSERYNAEVFEYFIYHRYRLLPGGDIRKYIQSGRLITFDIQAASRLKVKALNCYVSQTTLLFSWQTRPILPRERVDEISRLPEVFLRYDRNLSGTKVFTRFGTWIRFIHMVEPILKQKKEELFALFPIRNISDGSS